MACPVLARDDGEWIVSMGHPAWMRWVAGWVIASIGCWMKKTIGGNRPNLRRAGTAHARHRAQLPGSICRAVSARSASASRMERPVSAGRKRPLEALSRRQPVLPPPSAVEPASPAPSVQPDPVVSEADDAWPDDDNFRVDRWKRSSGPSSPSPADPSPVDPAPMASPRTTARRPLPRSSRRRD